MNPRNPVSHMQDEDTEKCTWAHAIKLLNPENKERIIKVAKEKRPYVYKITHGNTCIENIGFSSEKMEAKRQQNSTMEVLEYRKKSPTYNLIS